MTTEFDGFLQLRLHGVAYWGETPFDMPIVSQIDGNLWQGGSPEQLSVDLPAVFDHVLNLYPWGEYGFHHLTDMRVVKMTDGERVDAPLIEDLAAWVNSARATGPTLVHCQVGLNRSSLVTGLALIRSGMTPDAAIALIREKRSPACLCNPVFEAWLRDRA